MTSPRIAAAREAIKSGEFDKARALAAEVLSDSPNDVDAIEIVALAALEQGDDRAAEQALRKAIAVAPARRWPYADLGRLMLKLGRMADAEEVSRMALTADPANPDARAMLGSILNEREAWDEAAIHFEAALAGSGNHPLLLANLGRAQLRQGRLEKALSTLPEKLAATWELDWSTALAALGSANAAYVIGRGPGLGIAQEAALKLKETCGIQAEAFSAAEVRHGPIAVVRGGFPVLLFGQGDETLESVADVAAELASRNAVVISAGVPGAAGISLPMLDCDPLIAPILQIASFYRLANALAFELGHDPDRPPHLKKVTETL